MTTGQEPVVDVSGREDDSAADRENPVSQDAHLFVRYRGANNEQDHPRCGRPRDAQVTMPRNADAYCHDAEWQYQHQHLDVQMALHERHQHGKGAGKQRQCQAVRQAQR